MSLDTVIATVGRFDSREQNHSFLEEHIELGGTQGNSLEWKCRKTRQI